MIIDEVNYVSSLERQNESEIEDFFAHHGVKGMRWGQRKASSSKIFAPTTKSERKAIRRSSSGQEGRKILRNLAVSVGVGVTAGHLVKRIVRKHTDLLTASLAGDATALIGSYSVSKMLENQRVKSHRVSKGSGG